MTERLTNRLLEEYDGKWIEVKDNYGSSASIHYNDFECGMFYDAIAKLAHYEDLEEQGRLVVLPEGYDKDTFSKHLALTACPAFVGLKDWQGTEKCKDTTECCKECWEKALKGE